MRELIQQHGTVVSIVMVLVIVAFAVIGYLYIRKQRHDDKLLNHRGIIEMIPSFISTLGVLGTFAGITLGLYYFDTSNLTNSIPMLLNGLKTAFFTSLAGMVGSMFLSAQVNKLFDQKTAGISDSTQAAGIIVNELQELQNTIKNQSSQQIVLLGNLIEQNNNLISVMNNIDSLSNGIYQNNLRISRSTDEILNAHGGMLNEIVRSTDGIGNRAESMLLTLGNMEETDRAILSKAEEEQTKLGEMLDHTEALVSGQEVISEHVSKFGDRLHGEVVEIEDKMTETNTLLTTKFEEFSELLKKSNTEALVEVMKKVTEEFQKQMNSLINKLIQENFDQLNKSVEQLNTWQKENKEMIQSLTQQYKQMAENFESTSTSLTKVDEDTRQLVSEGGKLHQIVDSLNKVIVEDEKFIKISTDLQNTADLTKKNYEQFDTATKTLNEWVKKQRNFVDGVMVLIQKLEELNKIRDYGEEFWKETREQMNEGVGIISGGTRTLNEQVTDLNNQFYARLSATLTNLDSCIQALITNAEEDRR